MRQVIIEKAQNLLYLTLTRDAFHDWFIWRRVAVDYSSTNCNSYTYYCISVVWQSRMGLLGKLLLAIVTLTAVGIGYIFYTLNQVPPLPELKSTWWGAGQPRKLDESIRSFKVNISDDVRNAILSWIIIMLTAHTKQRVGQEAMEFLWFAHDSAPYSYGMQ